MPNDVIPLPEPVYYQWRRKNMPWSLEFAFSHMCHATTEDSEIRTLHPGDQMHAHAAAVSAAARDCRTCRNTITQYGVTRCNSTVVCTDADRYEPLPPVRLWRTT